jgi:hypothetical protein
MSKTEVIRLMWGGREITAHTIEALQRYANVEITLPANMHHALLSRFYPDATAAAVPEEVNIAGGTELITTLATLAGLEGLAGLAEYLDHAGYRLQLRSPGPVLSLIPPQMAAARM